MLAQKPGTRSRAPPGQESHQHIAVELCTSFSRPCQSDFTRCKKDCPPAFGEQGLSDEQRERRAADGAENRRSSQFFKINFKFCNLQCMRSPVNARPFLSPSHFTPESCLMMALISHSLLSH